MRSVDESVVRELEKIDRIFLLTNTLTEQRNKKLVGAGLTPISVTKKVYITTLPLRDS